MPGPTGKFLQLNVPLFERGDLLLFLGQRHVQLQEETQILKEVGHRGPSHLYALHELYQDPNI